MFRQAYRAETDYARQLRKIARQVGEIVAGHDGDPVESAALRVTLARYADIIRPWAKAAAGRMLADVGRRDASAWAKYTRSMARAVREELDNAPTGEVTRRLMAEQVDLITSLPTDAAERVHRLALESIETGTRADTLAAEIMRTGEVTRSRANLIARTETSRAASAFTQARAEHIGSVAYVWRTARDGDVRPSHRKMEGKPVQWDTPPTLDGMTGHAGALPNCRCYAEPVLPDQIN